jgi:hypothetical protein
MDVEEGVPSTAIREVSVTSIGNLPCRSIRYSSNLANSSPKENATTFFFLVFYLYFYFIIPHSSNAIYRYPC